MLATCGLFAVVLGATLVAWRAAGVPGVGGALLALALAGAIWSAGPLRGVDWLAAGAIGLALAAPPERGRARLILLVLAGLVRPEAWLLPPLLVLAGDRRRVRAAIAWGVAAPGLWLLFDGLLLDDPLLAFHRTDALAGIAAPGPGLVGLVGLVVGAAGIGVLVAPFGAWRLWATDALPGLVLAAVPIALVAEVAVGYPVRERYALLLVPAVGGAVGLAGAVPRAPHRRRVGDPGGARPAPRHHARRRRPPPAADPRARPGRRHRRAAAGLRDDRRRRASACAHPACCLPSPCSRDRPLSRFVPEPAPGTVNVGCGRRPPATGCRCWRRGTAAAPAGQAP